MINNFMPKADAGDYEILLESSCSKLIGFHLYI